MTPQKNRGAPARLVLVGALGYGKVHAERIARLAEQGEVDLVAVVDPGLTREPPTIYGAPLHADLDHALSAVGPVDVVVVAAPLGVHAQLAETALRAGADVLLEKPPVASLDDFRRLLVVERETGRSVQVGFQSLGSAALERIRSSAYGIGAVLRVSAVGIWSRTAGYWSRSPWAGRRSLRGRPVVDGVVTNPLAHAVATALAVAGCREMDHVASVETDLFRANPIDSDDTSVVRVRTSAGLDVTCALTLCAAEQRAPVVHVTGERGRIELGYTEDQVRVTTSAGEHRDVSPRTDLLENLLDHRRTGAALLVPLASAGAFMRVLDAVARADEPTRIDPRAIRWEAEGVDRRPVVAEVERWLDQAAAEGRTLTELGVPWAHAGRDEITVHAVVGGREVAAYRDGGGTILTSSPRPYLHPVRTRAGVVVSAHHAADHDWHNGVGLAVPDVNGSSFWGGGTYVHGQGYVLLDNHGRIAGDPPSAGPGGFVQDLRWLGHDGTVLLRERRDVAWSAVDDRTWRLTWESTLRAEIDLTLASPGSKGRVDGGYGGFFWRFPACHDADVFTAAHRGEDAVLGTVAPWVAFGAEFAAGPGIGGPATIVLAAPEAAAAGEPWFVRIASYPGLGSALAWTEALSLPAGTSYHRRFDAAVVDGRLTPAEAADLAGRLGA